MRIIKTYKLEIDDPTWKRDFIEQFNLLRFVERHHPELFDEEHVKNLHRMFYNAEFNDADWHAFHNWCMEFMDAASQVIWNNPDKLPTEVVDGWKAYSQRFIELYNRFTDWMHQQIERQSNAH